MKCRLRRRKSSEAAQIVHFFALKAIQPARFKPSKSKMRQNSGHSRRPWRRRRHFPTFLDQEQSDE
jgi:hypothetical protein